MLDDMGYSPRRSEGDEARCWCWIPAAPARPTCAWNCCATTSPRSATTWSSPPRTAPRSRFPSRPSTPGTRNTAGAAPTWTKNQAVLQMDVNAEGAIGKENLQILLNTFISIAEDFSAMVRARSKRPSNAHRKPRQETGGVNEWSARSPRSGTLSGDFWETSHEHRHADWHRSGQTQLPSAWAGRGRQDDVSQKCSRQDLFKLLGNTPRSTVVMEACAGAHWMARRIEELGHQAKLICSCAPSYRATRMTSPMPRRSARRPRARACGS